MKCYASKCRGHCIQDGGCGLSEHAPKNISTQLSSLGFPVSTQPSLVLPVSTQPSIAFPVPSQSSVILTQPNVTSTSNIPFPSSSNMPASNGPSFFSEAVDGRDFITDKRRTKRDAFDEAKAVSRKVNTEVSVFFWVSFFFGRA